MWACVVGIAFLLLLILITMLHFLVLIIIIIKGHSLRRACLQPATNTSLSWRATVAAVVVVWCCFGFATTCVFYLVAVVYGSNKCFV